MDGLTGEEAAVVAIVREFVDREVKPVVREFEHANAYPEKLIEQMKQLASSAWPSRNRGRRRRCPLSATPQSPRSCPGAG